MYIICIIKCISKTLRWNDSHVAYPLHTPNIMHLLRVKECRGHICRLFYERRAPHNLVHKRDLRLWGWYFGSAQFLVESRGSVRYNSDGAHENIFFAMSLIFFLHRILKKLVKMAQMLKLFSTLELRTFFLRVNQGITLSLSMPFSISFSLHLCWE